MHYTNVQMEVMQMRAVGMYRHIIYQVLASNFDEARNKAISKAETEGYLVIRITQTWD